MTDEDEQYLIATNFGVYGPSYVKPCYSEKSIEKLVIYHNELDITYDDRDIDVSIDHIILLSDLMSEYSELAIPDDLQEEED